MSDPFEPMRGGLVVSCQAPPGSPLRDTAVLVALARAAEAGGAVAIRAEGVDAVAAIKQAVAVPVIGLLKVPGGDVYITPTAAGARAVAAAGADVVALDATLRPRPDGGSMPELVAELSAELTLLADVDSEESGVAAREAGAAAVATTLAGYTGGGPAPEEPDVELVRRLAARLDCPLLAEGRYATHDHVRAALAAGAYAVCVGTAITDAVALTRRLAGATERSPDGAAA